MYLAAAEFEAFSEQATIHRNPVQECSGQTRSFPEDCYRLPPALDEELLEMRRIQNIQEERKSEPNIDS